MVAKVSSLLKTVKNVEAEAGRGVRSLENTIDHIEDDLKEFNSANPPKKDASPEDLIRSTKGITLASAKVSRESPFHVSSKSPFHVNRVSLHSMSVELVSIPCQ